MAKRRGRKPKLESISIAALERVLARRMRDVGRLEKRRDALRSRLEALEVKLGALKGKAGPGRPVAVAPVKAVRGRRRRAGGKLTLGAAIAQVLQGATAPMRAAEILAAVQAIGYKSKSKNFRQIVHTTLTRLPAAKRIKKGLYVFNADAGERPARKRGRPAAAKKAETA